MGIQGGRGRAPPAGRLEEAEAFAGGGCSGRGTAEVGDADLGGAGVVEERLVGLDADDLFALVDEHGFILKQFEAGDGGGEALDGAFDGGGEEVVGDLVGVGHAQEGIGFVLHAGFVGGGGFGLMDGTVGGEEAEVEPRDISVFVLSGGENPEVHVRGAFGGHLLLGDVPLGAVFGAIEGAGVDECLRGALGVVGSAAGERQKGKRGCGEELFHRGFLSLFGWWAGGRRKRERLPATFFGGPDKA